jgi:tetratricopeptide (TPR) repeat protein
VAFNLGQALYYRSVYGNAAEESTLLVQSLKAYDIALIGPGFPIPGDALVMKAKALARLGRKEQAKAELARALEVDPD